MGWPDHIVPPEMSQACAHEVLTLLSDEAVSDELRHWLGFLRGEYANAKAQGSML